MKLEKEQFLAAITTTHGSNWREKIKEIDELKLEKVAIFPTCLRENQRQEMYRLLEKTCLKEIPFIHIRSDMPPEELDYLVKRFKAQVFNVHTPRQYPFIYNIEKYYKQIYLENNILHWEEDEIKIFAGVCLDFSHLTDTKLLYPDIFKKLLEIISKYKIGCNHISAIDKEAHFVNDPGDSRKCFSRHSFTDLSQFDYLKEYPREFFSKFCAIELENSLAEQLKVIDYIYEICR